MKKVELDLDGVLLDTMSYFCEIYNLLNKTNKTIYDMTRYGFFEDWGETEEEFWNVFDFCQLDEIEPLDNKAPKYIKKIAKKYRVDIVTAREEKQRKDIMECLERIGLIQGIHFTQLKLTLHPLIDSKLDIPYDLYIDDSTNLAKLIQNQQYHYVYGTRQMLLWQQPWNWNVVSGNGVYRVTGWKDIIKWFKNNNL